MKDVIALSLLQGLLLSWVICVSGKRVNPRVEGDGKVVKLNHATSTDYKDATEIEALVNSQDRTCARTINRTLVYRLSELNSLLISKLFSLWNLVGFGDYTTLPTTLMLTTSTTATTTTTTPSSNTTTLPSVSSTLSTRLTTSPTTTTTMSTTATAVQNTLSTSSNITTIASTTTSNAPPTSTAPPTTTSIPPTTSATPSSTITNAPPTTATTSSTTTTGSLCSCGIQKTKVDGTPQWPWQAALYYDTLFICSATLINPEWVLTSGYPILELSLGYTYLYFGAYNLSAKDSPTTLKRLVDRFVVYQPYNPATGNNNIGLIHFAQPLTYNETIQPACLPLAYSTTQWSRKQGNVTGWGHIGQSTDSLRTNTQGLTDCGDQICTQSTASNCTVDYGSPLTYEDPSNGRVSVIGVFSSGICKGEVGRFTKVSSFITWIEQTTGATFCHP